MNIEQMNKEQVSKKINHKIPLLSGGAIPIPAKQE